MGHNLLRSSAGAWGLQAGMRTARVPVPSPALPVTPTFAYRVHTLSVPVVTELTDMYNAADPLALCGLMSKLAVEKSLVSRLEDARTMLQTKVRGRQEEGGEGTA